MNKKTFLASVFSLIIGVVIAHAAATPVFAQMVDQPHPMTQPTITLSYRAPNFYVTAGPNVQRVQYAITYVHPYAGVDVQEQLSMSGKANRRGVYSGRIFAGTQSSHYFIAHKVKSGNIDLSATESDGNVFFYNADFIINARHRLMITNVN